jgi:hypothetical protein
LNVEGLTGVSTKELGLRFNIVSLLPNATLVLFALALIASGAPRQAPSLDKLLAAVDNLSVERVAAVLALVLIVSLILHPFQFSLVQLLEGYWDGTAFGRALGALGKELHRRRRQRLEFLVQQAAAEDYEGDDEFEEREEEELGQEGRQAAEELRQYPDRTRLLPTMLGNTLRAAEDEAGARYGLPTIAAMPRLYPYLSDRFAAVYVDRRNQLDVAVRFSAVLILATVLSAAMLWANGGWWRIVPLGTSVLALVSYQAAVRAAANYGQALFVAFDLHRFDMLEALHYPLPTNLKDELDFNERLTRFFTQDDDLDEDYAHGADAVVRKPTETRPHLLAPRPTPLLPRFRRRGRRES